MSGSPDVVCRPLFLVGRNLIVESPPEKSQEKTGFEQLVLLLILFLSYSVYFIYLFVLCLDDTQS